MSALIATFLVASMKSQATLNLHDPGVQKELNKYFKIEKDEFDPQGRIKYTPKNYKPLGGDYLYCYFYTTAEGIPYHLTLEIMTIHTGYLGVKSYNFIVCDKIFVLEPDETKSDVTIEAVYEWSYTSIRTDNLPLINALAECDEAYCKVKLNGSEYFNVIAIYHPMMEKVERVLHYYKALGGTF